MLSKTPKSLVIAFILPLFFNVFGLFYINKISFLIGFIILSFFLLFAPTKLIFLLVGGGSSFLFAIYSVIAANYSNNANAFTSEIDSKHKNKMLLLFYQVFLLAISFIALFFMFGLVVIFHPAIPAVFIGLHIINIYLSSRYHFTYKGSYVAIFVFLLGLYLAINYHKYVFESYRASDIPTGDSILMIVGLFFFVGLYFIHTIIVLIDVFANIRRVKGAVIGESRRRKNTKSRPKKNYHTSHAMKISEKELEIMIKQIRPFAKKKYQLCIDTNVAMNPTSREALRYFLKRKHTIYISEKVIDELDKHKMSSNNETKAKSRAATNLFIEYKHLAKEQPKPAIKYISNLRLDRYNPDDVIIATYCQLLKHGPVLFITGDGNPIFRAERAGLHTVRLKSK